ncbi:phage virion morphogenesis protein, partial [Uruburuella suis]|uniref:phage virion morphogenesis protein n=1 Tax=Uruburuella suis TaxID=252130 RepID=UPI0024902A30
MITLEIDDDDFHRGLGRLLKNATNARPMMRAIATEMTSITEDNFERESFGSDRWEKSQRATDENGKKIGRA